MEPFTTKERILKNIRESLLTTWKSSLSTVDLDTDVYDNYSGLSTKEEAFVENFLRGGGNLVYSENIEAVVVNLMKLVRMNAWEHCIFCNDPTLQVFLEAGGITYSSREEDVLLKDVLFVPCSALIANTGGILFSSEKIGRKIFCSAKVIVFVAIIDQVVENLASALQTMNGNEGPLPSMMSIWTGDSKIIDIDQNEYRGVNPQKVYVYLIESQNAIK